MKGVRQQEEATDEFRLFRGEHACLATAVRVATDVNFFVYGPPEGFDGLAQPFAIGGRLRGKWWSGAPVLTEWQIASQHCEVQSGEGIGQRNEERRLAVGSRAMCEDDSAGWRLVFYLVQVAVYAVS